MISRTDILQARAELGKLATPDSVLDRLVERFGPTALRQLAIVRVQEWMAPPKAGRFRSDDVRWAQFSFEFLKASYPNESETPTPVEELSLIAGLAIRAKLLHEAEEWAVPRYRDEGALKRQEAAELEQLLRARFGDEAVDAQLGEVKHEGDRDAV